MTAPPVARLPPLVRGVVLGAGPAVPLPLLDVLGRAGRLLHALALLGRDHRLLRPPHGEGAGAARHGRSTSSRSSASWRSSCKQSPFRFLAAGAARRAGAEPAPAGPVDGHPPAGHVRGLRLALGPLRLRHRAPSGRSGGTAGSSAPCPGRSSPSSTLGTAILMGGYWAYKTLGWGGYWAWDPVENTSLVPWLATVGPRPRDVPPEGAREAPEDQHHPRDPRLLLHPLRHVPDALGRPRRLLGPLLRRPRHHRLARRRSSSSSSSAASASSPSAGRRSRSSPRSTRRPARRRRSRSCRAPSSSSSR